jgi:hypothetical protein
MWSRHDASQAQTASAPLDAMASSFASSIAAETPAFLTANVPPNPGAPARELADLRPYVGGARAGRRHDRVEAVEYLHEAACQAPSLVEIAGVVVHLPAAGLLAREPDADAGALQELDGRAADLGRDRVPETRDEERDRHPCL